MSGHEGPAAAGDVINAFGNFVVGNNYVIGLIVFVILVVINFIVITKGAGRVAEVSARFTLDAMPGKQMAIDADLNSGLINESEARNRRSEIEQEANFYGAMDGASKFVRGDAIAGIIITLVNIIGGLLIGVIQQGLDVSRQEAAKLFGAQVTTAQAAQAFNQTKVQQSNLRKLSRLDGKSPIGQDAITNAILGLDAKASAKITQVTNDEQARFNGSNAGVRQFGGAASGGF